MGDSVFSGRTSCVSFKSFFREFSDFLSQSSVVIPLQRICVGLICNYGNPFLISSLCSSPPATNCTVTNCTSTGFNTRTCTSENITSLFDLCGVCLGDFSACFFKDVNQAQQAGIAGGVIAGIVVAAVVAALLVAFFARKSYLAWQAKSAFGAGTANSNPAFQDNSLSGNTAALG